MNICKKNIIFNTFSESEVYIFGYNYAYKIHKHLDKCLCFQLDFAKKTKRRKNII